MSVLQDLVMQKGAQSCRLVVQQEDTAVLATVSQLGGRDAGHAPPVAVQTRFSEPDKCAWEALVEAFVALKMQEGYVISQHYATSPRIHELSLSLSGGSLPSLDSMPSTCERENGSFLSDVSPFDASPSDDSAAGFLPADMSGRLDHKKGCTDIRSIAQYFRYPISDAAQMMDICPTVLKKICRRHGINRWPQRKLKSIEKRVQELAARAPEAGVDRASLQAKIAELQEEMHALTCGQLSLPSHCAW